MSRWREPAERQTGTPLTIFNCKLHKEQMFFKDLFFYLFFWCLFVFSEAFPETTVNQLLFLFLLLSFFFLTQHSHKSTQEKHSCASKKYYTRRSTSGTSVDPQKSSDRPKEPRETRLDLHNQLAATLISL